jgi:hypothetical protein
MSDNQSIMFRDKAGNLFESRRGTLSNGDFVGVFLLFFFTILLLYFTPPMTDKLEAGIKVEVSENSILNKK